MDLIKKTINNFLRDFKIYLPIVVLALVIKYITYFAEAQFGPQEEMAKLLINIIFFIFFFWVNASLIVQFQSLKEDKKPLSNGILFWEGFCATPGFVLYNLIISLIFLAGGVFLLVPGIYFLVLFYYAPYLSVLNWQADRGMLGQSKLMVQRYFWKSMWVFLIAGLIPLIGLWPNLLPAFAGKSIIELMMIPIETGLSLVCEFGLLVYLYELKDKLGVISKPEESAT